MDDLASKEALGLAGKRNNEDGLAISIASVVYINFMAWPLHTSCFPFSGVVSFFCFIISRIRSFLLIFVWDSSTSRRTSVGGARQGMASVQTLTVYGEASKYGFHLNVMYRPILEGLRCMLVVLKKKKNFF